MSTNKPFCPTDADLYGDIFDRAPSATKKKPRRVQRWGGLSACRNIATDEAFECDLEFEVGGILRDAAPDELPVLLADVLGSLRGVRWSNRISGTAEYSDLAAADLLAAVMGRRQAQKDRLPGAAYLKLEGVKPCAVTPWVAAAMKLRGWTGEPSLGLMSPDEDRFQYETKFAAATRIKLRQANAAKHARTSAKSSGRSAPAPPS